MGPAHATELDAVRSLVAVQAQDYAGARWAIGQRVASSSSDAVDRLLDSGAVVRTHVLRPTWHLVAAEDIRWLLALTGPRVQRANAGWYGRQEIDAGVVRTARAVLERVLGGGRSQTREELGRAFGEAGIPSAGPRLAGLMMHEELEGFVCSGPMRGPRQTYALLDERIPPTRARDRDEALAELARRYVGGHGPAQAIDLAWWSGLTIRDARRGLELSGAVLARERVAPHRELWTAAADERPVAESTLRLLPNWDELIVAFRDRADAIHPGLPPAAREPAALLSNVVVRDGLVIGTWARTVDRGRLGVAATLHVSLDAAGRGRLDGAAAALAAFLGRPGATVSVD